MYLLYIFCLLPILIGYIVKIFNPRIQWREWMIGALAAFLLALPIHYWSYHGQVGDYETWSGKITSAQFIPRWHEYYEYAVYRTEFTYDEKGNINGSYQVFDHWEEATRWHEQYWMAYSNINTSYNISESKYKYFVKNFKNESKERGDRTTSEHNSRMISGDPYDYVTYLKDDFVEPITDTRYFVNRIKAAKSVFNFVTPPKEIQVFDYPQNADVWRSNRLLGTAPKDFDIRLVDEMNARLGPTKRVNVIIIGFNSSDSSLAEWQRSKWIGGKKNDLVICYGTKWVKAFGWSESDICKRNIETLFLQNNKTNDLLKLLEAEIWSNYKKREFTEDFQYLTIEPEFKHWMVFIILMILIQGGLYVAFHHENLFKN